ncbi:hypothetical protein NGA_0704800 [Nannochloropsis gaditana CCMP526]|uniref:uncharacterized protein n=1 Tax=Nannochloropsis gaditana (strain CCMP526) TaxID=1093141 RepID=UPI00029F5DE8|nr:hypothetical protein NGA_0704800 [Nannochloropsis gaditana CCMP526]EKU23253.1 hypothetical protein NGA_0704800 [Nannochloropsis gaditana CCMP526]|eukprot:XP_005852579.1 hypothetical protein NGA_0704800 [Nannochloropsis gaditana CCMP526]
MEGGHDSRCGHEATVAGIGEVVEVGGEEIEGVLESEKWHDEPESGRLRKTLLGCGREKKVVASGMGGEGNDGVYDMPRWETGPGNGEPGISRVFTEAGSSAMRRDTKDKR